MNDLNKEDYNIYQEGVMKLLKYDSNKIIQDRKFTAQKIMVQIS